jgi:hypothetical protein
MIAGALTGKPVSMVEHHVDEVTLSSLVDGSASKAVRQASEVHLAHCSLCRADLEDLRSFAAGLPVHGLAAMPPSAHPRIAWWRRPVAIAALAAGVILAVAAAVSYWLTPPRRGDTAEANARAAVTERPDHGSAVRAVLQDVDGPLALRDDGAIDGLPGVSGDVRASVARTLSAGELDVPQDVRALSAHRGTLLGDAPPSQSGFTVVAPLGTAVSADRPLFEWGPYEGASGYRVSVADDRFNIVARSGVITVRQWRPERPLPRGATYIWQVEALHGSTTTRAPAPPLAEARFMILSQAALEHLDRTLQASPRSHLARATVSARFGLIDDAMRDLRALRALNPRSAVAARLVDRLEAVRTP